jgi:hypothetical protein
MQQFYPLYNISHHYQEQILDVEIQDEQYNGKEFLTKLSLFCIFSVITNNILTCIYRSVQSYYKSIESKKQLLDQIKTLQTQVEEHTKQIQSLQQKTIGIDSLYKAVYSINCSNIPLHGNTLNRIITLEQGLAAIEQYIQCLKEKDSSFQTIYQEIQDEFVSTRSPFLRKDIYTKQIMSPSQRFLDIERFLLKFWQKQKMLYDASNKALDK